MSRPRAVSRTGDEGVFAVCLDGRGRAVAVLRCWHGRRTGLARHETLNAMLDWSYSLLSERQKVVLCRLSVFVGDFTLAAAGSVASESEVDDADVIDAVVSLVAKSLISTTVINVDILPDARHHARLGRYQTCRAWRSGSDRPAPRDLLFQISRTRRDHPVAVRRT
jgi:predicted ATPase